MSLITTDGLIIKEQKVGESDRLITILTRDNGLIRAFAPNALKLKSKNLSATQLLSYSRLVIYKSRDTYKVNDARTVELFYKLRSNIEALSLAGYFCELLQALAPQEDFAGDFLSVTLNCLHFLCEGNYNHNVIKAIAELKFCQFAGYMPNLVDCAKCGETQISNFSFDVLQGVIYCEKCNVNSSTVIAVPNGVLAAMRHIIYSEQNKLFSFTLSEESAKILSSITERFVIAQTDRTYKTLEFYNSVKL